MFSKKKHSNASRSPSLSPAVSRKESVSSDKSFQLNLNSSPLFARRAEAAAAAVCVSNSDTSCNQLTQNSGGKGGIAEDLRTRTSACKQPVVRSVTVPTTLDGLFSLSPVITKIKSPQAADVLASTPDSLQSPEYAEPHQSPEYAEVYQPSSSTSTSSSSLTRTPSFLRNTSANNPSSSTRSRTVVFENAKSVTENSTLFQELNQGFAKVSQKPHKLVTRNISEKPHPPVTPVDIKDTSLFEFPSCENSTSHKGNTRIIHSHRMLDADTDTPSSTTISENPLMDASRSQLTNHCYEPINRASSKQQNRPNCAQASIEGTTKEIPPPVPPHNQGFELRVKNTSRNYVPADTVDSVISSEFSTRRAQEIKTEPSTRKSNDSLRFTQFIKSPSTLSMLPNEHIEKLYKKSHLRHVDVDEVLGEEPPSFPPPLPAKNNRYIRVAQLATIVSSFYENLLLILIVESYTWEIVRVQIYLLIGLDLSGR